MQACTILPRNRPSTTDLTTRPGRFHLVTRAENAGRPRKPKRRARADRSLSLAAISRAAPPAPIRSRSTTLSISDFCSLLGTSTISHRAQVVARRLGELGGLPPNMGLKPCHHFIVDWRPTAIGVSAQDLGGRRWAVSQGRAIGERPTVQPLGHDLDPAPHTQILHAQFPQGEIEMTEHRTVEEFLRQHFAVGLAAEAVDHEHCMQGQRIEAPVECARERPRLDSSGARAWSAVRA